jgi:hypothetical protein
MHIVRPGDLGDGLSGVAAGQCLFLLVLVELQPAVAAGPPFPLTADSRVAREAPAMPSDEAHLSPLNRRLESIASVSDDERRAITALLRIRYERFERILADTEDSRVHCAGPDSRSFLAMNFARGMAEINDMSVCQHGRCCWVR